jgi:hypothetical protein
VHIGARVAVLAAPNEVLVSSTVKDLVAGSGDPLRKPWHSSPERRTQRAESFRCKLGFESAAIVCVKVYRLAVEGPL